MKHTLKSEGGFSLVELLTSMFILVPIMAAALSLFSTGTNQQASEQRSVDVNQEARSGLEMMTRELAQAGSHRDRSTTTTAAITGSDIEQDITVVSAVGITAGDWVDIDTDSNSESVQLTQVAGNSIRGIFTQSHNAGVPVSLFAYSYVTGVIPPPGLGANSTSAVTTLKFFGDINADINSTANDANLYYVEYAYDSVNNQITRSATPITQGDKNAAIPLIRNIKPDSAHFRVNTNGLGIVTSADIAMTVCNTWSTAKKYEEAELSSSVLIPSALAGTALIYELQEFQTFNRLPATPSKVIAWASQ